MFKNHCIEAMNLPLDPNEPLAPPKYKLTLNLRIPGAFTFEEAKEIVKATSRLNLDNLPKALVLDRLFLLFTGEEYETYD